MLDQTWQKNKKKLGRWVGKMILLILMNYPHGARKKIERKKESKKDHVLQV